MLSKSWLCTVTPDALRHASAADSGFGRAGVLRLPQAEDALAPQAWTTGFMVLSMPLTYINPPRRKRLPYLPS